MDDCREKTIVFLATGGWIGFAPVAPGTFGSLAALPICLLLARMPSPAASLALAAFILFSIWIAQGAEKIVRQKDPQQVVIDEICGMMVTLFGLPFTPASVVWGIALFRVFDILKPFPIRWVERKVPGGLGVVLDDIIAGLIANALLRAGLHLLGNHVL